MHAKSVRMNTKTGPADVAWPGERVPVDPLTGLALNRELPPLPETPSTPAVTETLAQAFAEY